MNGTAARSDRKLEYVDVGNLSRRVARVCWLCGRVGCTANFKCANAITAQRQPSRSPLAAAVLLKTRPISS